jgi:hypothetical protein
MQNAHPPEGRYKNSGSAQLPSERKSVASPATGVLGWNWPDGGRIRPPKVSESAMRLPEAERGWEITTQEKPKRNLATTIQVASDLACGLCRECRTHVHCPKAGVCQLSDAPIDAAELARMRAAEASEKSTNLVRTSARSASSSTLSSLQVYATRQRYVNARRNRSAAIRSL